MTPPYVKDFLLQEKMAQDPAMAGYHARSLNTVRLISLRLNGSYHIIAATFRMGCGSFVDNGHAGGLLCGIDITSGALTPFAYNVVFEKFDKHPLSGTTFGGKIAPRFEAIKKLAVDTHDRLAQFDVVSFDIALNAQGQPTLIETNLFGQGIEPHQVLKGTHLFGPQADEVFAKVRERHQKGWHY